MQLILPKFRRRTSRRLCYQVPPSPDLLIQLYSRWKSLHDSHRLPEEITFEQFFSVWSSTRRGENLVGLDDGKTRNGPSTDLQLIDRPPVQLK